MKCLHAHYANHLRGGDDPIGRWVRDALVERGETRPAHLVDGATSP